MQAILPFAKLWSNDGSNGGSAPAASFILQEDASYILLEDGSKVSTE